MSDLEIGKHVAEALFVKQFEKDILKQAIKEAIAELF